MMFGTVLKFRTKGPLMKLKEARGSGLPLTFDDLLSHFTFKTKALSSDPQL